MENEIFLQRGAIVDVVPVDDQHQPRNGKTHLGVITSLIPDVIIDRRPFPLLTVRFEDAFRGTGRFMLHVEDPAGQVLSMPEITEYNRAVIEGLAHSK